MTSQGYGGLTPAQRAGSEYGGTYSHNTVQPKAAEALTAAEQLRLGYLTGDTSDALQLTELSLEDHRQMLGLKPAGNTRPTWLAGTGRAPQAEILGVAYPDELSSFQADWDIPGGY